MCRIRFLAVVVLILASADRAGAQVEAPLADRVPRDALMYAGWAGADALQQRYAGTHAEALFNQSSLAQVFEQTLPRLGAALSMQKPDARPWVKFSTDILPILYRHPTAIAFGGIDTTNPEQPLPRILLICDAGDDAALLRNKLGELFSMVKNVGLFTLMDVQDGVLYLNLGWQKLDLAIARDDPSKALASDDRFVSAMRGMIEQPVSAVFLDLPGLVRVAEEAGRRDKGEQAVQDLHKFLDASGLRGLGSVTVTTGFQDKQYATSAFIESRSPRTGLMYHGWDAARAQKWADKETGLSQNFWGRAMGWYLMGAVDVLDYLPRNHPDRGALIRLVAEAAEAVTRVQDPESGLWWQVLDQPNRAGNYLEASASSMFVYALAKAARLGYIDSSYRAVATRGFDGLVSDLVKVGSDGLPSLTNICQVAGLGGNLRRDGSYRDGSFAYYISEPIVADDYKGVGPFIMAAHELGR